MVRGGLEQLRTLSKETMRETPQEITLPIPTELWVAKKEASDGLKMNL